MSDKKPDKKIAVPAVQLSGLADMAYRLHREGGNKQVNRMIDGKVWTLRHAIEASYQSAQVEKVDHILAAAPALMNPNKLKPDYDDKVISIEFQYGYKPGDVFEWKNTHTIWIIYLQDLTEVAYFKGDVRRCSYSIDFLNSSGEIQKVYAAVRGPVETKIRSIEKSGISVDTPNHSLELLIPKNEETLQYFQRYSKFYLQGLQEGDKPTCWRVEATDTLSMPGVLQLHVVEYYSNKDVDDVEAGIANGLLEKPQEPAPNLIKGPEHIKPHENVTFTYLGKVGIWKFDKDLPITYSIDRRVLHLTWNDNYSGQFTVQCGNATKVVTVDSLF